MWGGMAFGKMLNMRQVFDLHTTGMDGMRSASLIIHREKGRERELEF